MTKASELIFNIDSLSEVHKSYKNSNLPKRGDRIKVIDTSSVHKGKLGTISEPFTAKHHHEIKFDDGNRAYLKSNQFTKV